MVKSSAILALIATTVAVELRLPKVYSSHVSAFEDKVIKFPYSRPEEYKQSGMFHVWSDETSGKSLVHVHSDQSSHHTRGSPNHGRLTDYVKQLVWSWDWDEQTRTVKNCVLAKTSGPQITYSVGAPEIDFKLVSSGTIGKTQKVDNYDGYYKNTSTPIDYEEQVGITMEAGTTDTPIESELRMRGFDEETKEQVQGYRRETFWDFTVESIPAAQFAVPEECPA